jgi:hypothetical protein
MATARAHAATLVVHEAVLTATRAASIPYTATDWAAWPDGKA